MGGGLGWAQVVHTQHLQGSWVRWTVGGCLCRMFHSSVGSLGLIYLEVAESQKKQEADIV